MTHRTCCRLLLGVATAFLQASLIAGYGAEAEGALLVPAGSTWRYNDTGTNLGTAWRGQWFDDAAWPAGLAPLGYGETNQATTISYGPDPDNKFITTYFRQSFVVTNPAQFNRLFVRVRRDDGAVVYLNGTEIFRNNLPAGTITAQTFALTNVYGTGERTYHLGNLASLLAAGTNSLAAEVHQAAADSVDLAFDLELSASNLVEITRGPYLQMATPTNLLVRWRTAQPASSRIQFGTNPENLNLAADDATATIEHELWLTNLVPNTKYYYSVGTDSQIVAGGSNYFFFSAPIAPKPTRVWITGDTRTGDVNQAAVRDAYYDYADRYTDVWLMVGDDGGPTGSDQGFSDTLFNFFPEQLRQTPLWPAIGNHETYYNYYDMPYLHIFSLPTNGEAGGVASGSERYYSFDYGNIHFVVLDTVTTDMAVGGAMYTWLAEDLAETRSDWLIAYFHYPPYSKGSHDSDYEGGMIEVRQNFVPLLESNGVDLVLVGHSHVYERSYLLDSWYGYSWEWGDDNFKSVGDGRRDGSGPYHKPTAGRAPHEGAVYVVMGSSGMVSGGSLDHPAMYYSVNQLGSMVLDIDGQTLEAKFLRETGAIDDYFTIIKGDLPVRITNVRYQAGQVSLTWNSVVGRSYVVERRDSLTPESAWTPITAEMVAETETSNWTDTSPGTEHGFYRVLEIANP